MEDWQTLTKPGVGEILQKSIHLIEIGQYDLAERELRTALAAEPQMSDLHVHLGWVLFQKKQKNEAEEECKVALGLDPDNGSAMHLLGMLCEDTGRHREAEQHYLNALRIDPEEPRYYFAYGVLMQKTGHLDKAEGLLRRCLELDPDEGRAHGVLAAVLSEKQKVSETHGSGERSVSLDPDQTGSHFLLGLTYWRSGHPFKARRHLREALRIDPTNSDIEEWFRIADMSTRWLYLPMYFWTLLVNRLPGKQFAVWGAFMVVLFLMRGLNAPEAAAKPLVLGYLLLVIYTWLITPVAHFWIKLRPPR
ncbi:MAG: tetratricopeptide repeat protein [Armatimonadetes bacterium]|nr:tetratricopeptide repeat protein [Armatimonadota bacterium]